METKVEVADKTDYMEIVMEGGLDDDMFEVLLDNYIRLQKKYNNLIDSIDKERSRTGTND